MAWQTPKTDWQTADIVQPDDMNRIEGNIQELQNTKETPAGAQAKVDTHANLTNAHSATSAATANRIIIRDSAGRAKVTAPNASDDIARKAEVDTVQADLNSHKAEKATSATLGHVKVDETTITSNNGVISTLFSVSNTEIDIMFKTQIPQNYPVIMGYPITKLSNPSTLPAGTGFGAAFSPDGTYLAIAHSASPYVTIYKRSGDTFTKLSNPSTLPANDGYGAAFSSDGTYLAIAHGTSPYVTIYKRSGDTFTKLSNPSTLPAGTGFGAAFSSDGTYLAIAHDASPYVTIYKDPREVAYKGDEYFDPTIPVTALGYTKEAGNGGEVKKVALIWRWG